MGIDAEVYRLVYRSTPTRVLSTSERFELYGRAQIHNSTESISGALVLTPSTYYQWLEGPRAAIETLYDRIRQDKRHESVEVLHEGVFGQRYFSAWSMLDASAEPSLTLFGPSRDPVHIEAEALARDPVNELSRYGRQYREDAVFVSPILRNSALAPWSSVWRRAPAPLSGYIAKLQHLNLAASALGNAWTDDRITSTHLTLGYIRLLETARRTALPWVEPPTATVPRVLVANAPGEKHVLRARLDAMLFEALQWDVCYMLPETRDALYARVAGEHFDAVEVASSSIFSRPAQTESVRSMLLDLAELSYNQNIACIASGRADDEALAPPHSRASIAAD